MCLSTGNVGHLGVFFNSRMVLYINIFIDGELQYYEKLLI